MRSIAVTLLAVAIVSVAVSTTGDALSPTTPGVLGAGTTLLPNGWKIAPAGRHVAVGDLPLDLVESPDGQYVVVTNNGYATPSLSVVRLADGIVRETVQLDHAWLGMAWHPDGRRLFVSGAANDTIHEVVFEGRALTKRPDRVLGPPFQRPAEDENSAPDPNAVPVPTTSAHDFVGGMAVSPDGRTLYAVEVFGQRLLALDVDASVAPRSVPLAAEPYTVAVTPGGQQILVSLWGGAEVLVLDPRTLEVTRTISVGEHPNSMAISRDGTTLFVACANTNSVWVVDIQSGRTLEQVSVALAPSVPPGTTPNYVSLSPDGQRLLVANADNNTVAVVNVSTRGHSSIEGLIPTGWYPTAARFSRDGSRIFILSGKGLISSPNPRLRPGSNAGERQYIGGLLTGTLSIVPTPSPEVLQVMTTKVRELAPAALADQLAPPGAPPASPIPPRVGAPSPIKHVFYVLRENRSYDQVLGDLDRGNGDQTLAIFGEEVTPNAHALAREFGVLDNFYVDAEVSYDGHAFSMGAYATDFIEKIWPVNYARRGAAYLSEGEGTMRNAYGNVSAPLNGYIWDACNRAGVSVRSYGEFTHWEAGTERQRLSGQLKALPSVPGLKGKVAADYAPWDLQIPDNQRVDAWLREFHGFEANDSLPALSIVRIGNDHTAATRPGMPTPRAMVAENDAALGRLVEVISHSKYWKDSVIFVLEDDAQNGPDHVDAHRSPALAISPFSRRRTVDSTLYTTSGVLRTIELILGLPPMSQYDTAATPLYGAFQSTPDETPYSQLAARISLSEMNALTAYGASASLQMDLSIPDAVPDPVLTDVVWRSIKGAEAPVPAPVRSAFVRSAAGDDDGDDRPAQH
jgi:YVTN family beta-propeller protein